MAEYIEREALVAAFRKDAKRLGDIDCPWSPAAIEAEIEAMPAADVAPVVRGRWVSFDFDVTFSCSECGYTTDFRLSNYCPGCGAKLDSK